MKEQTAAESASADLSLAPAGNPEEEVATLYRNGLGLLDGEDFGGAGDAFRSILDLLPGDGRGHTGLGLLLANEGRETEAIRHLRLAQRSTPDLPETHYLLGLVEERLGRDPEALVHYQRTLELDPTFFMAHFNRAWILRRTGHEDAFVCELKEAHELLGRRPAASPWLTGGLSVETLLGLASEALDSKGVPCD